jgi:DNA-binding MarR family transcriptional regulator
MTGTAKTRRTRGRKASGASSAEAEAASPTANPALTALAERFPLWRRPGYLIRRLHQIHSAIFFEECADFGITPVQYGLLTVLSTNPDADQVALAHLVGIDRTNVADVLRRLERRGLISRAKSRTDRRMLLARLTLQGERLVEAMHPAMARAAPPARKPRPERARILRDDAVAAAGDEQSPCPGAPWERARG